MVKIPHLFKFDNGTCAVAGYRERGGCDALSNCFAQLRCTQYPRFVLVLSPAAALHRSYCSAGRGAPAESLMHSSTNKSGGSYESPHLTGKSRFLRTDASVARSGRSGISRQVDMARLLGLFDLFTGSSERLSFSGCKFTQHRRATTADRPTGQIELRRLACSLMQRFPFGLGPLDALPFLCESPPPVAFT